MSLNRAIAPSRLRIGDVGSLPLARPAGEAAGRRVAVLIPTDTTARFRFRRLPSLWGVAQQPAGVVAAFRASFLSAERRPSQISVPAAFNILNVGPRTATAGVARVVSLVVPTMPQVERTGVPRTPQGWRTQVSPRRVSPRKGERPSHRKDRPPQNSSSGGPPGTGARFPHRRDELPGSVPMRIPPDGGACSRYRKGRSRLPLA